MRGAVRIKSARAPYRRGGLVFGDQPTLIERIDALDGARLMAIVRDPVLTVEIGAQDGEYRPVPMVDAQATAEHFQLLIDAIAGDLPPRADAADPDDPAARLDAQERIESLKAALANREAENAALREDAAAKAKRIGELESALAAARGVKVDAPPKPPKAARAKAPQAND